jgi:hypothetical protein
MSLDPFETSRDILDEVFVRLIKGKHNMTSSRTSLGADSTQPTPDAVLAPIDNVISAVEETITNPTPAAIVNDVKVGVDLLFDLKNQVDNLHQSIWGAIRSLF